MATGTAGDGLFRGVFDGCISGHDTGIQSRPYHRNCGCALHKSRGNCSHSSPYMNVSYPIRRSWSESCLALAAAFSAASSGHSPPCSSPAVAAMDGGKKNLVRSTTEDHDDVVVFKVKMHRKHIAQKIMDSGGIYNVQIEEISESSAERPIFCQYPIDLVH